MRKPIYQNVTNFARAIAIGFIAVGSVFSALNNTRQWITPTITYWGSVVIAFAFLGGAVAVRVARPRWIIGGRETTLTGVNRQYWATLFGLLLVLWLPRVLPSSGAAPSVQSVTVIQLPQAARPDSAGSGAKVLPRLPFATGGGEAFQYYDNEHLDRVPRTPFLVDLIETSLVDVSHRLGANAAVEELGCKADIECFAQFWNHEAYSVVVFRSRESAALLPVHLEIVKDDLPWDVRYLSVCEGYEPMLVADVRHGSGNFVTVRVVAWNAETRRFQDLMTRFGPPAEEPEFPDGFFAFADLDGDGCKELIVTHGWKAIDPRTQYFTIRDGVFARVDPNTELFRDFQVVAEQVKDQTIWSNPRDEEKGR